MERKFDYISDYKMLWGGYCDPWVWTPYGSEDDEPEYIEERGYIVKHNGCIFKIWDWTFIQTKMWKVEQYDPSCECENKWHFKGDFKSLKLALDRVKELAE